MAQNTNDPRVQEYYRQQRTKAEHDAILGNTSAQNQLESIAGKLQKSDDPVRKRIGNEDARIASGSKNEGQLGGTGIPGVSDVDIASTIMAPVGAAGSVLREILTHPMTTEQIATHVGQAVGKQIAKKLFPDAEEDLMSTGAGKLAKVGAKKPSARVVGKAKVSDAERPAMKNVTPRKALPAKASKSATGVPKGTENPLRRAMAARTKQQTAKIKGAKARVGTKSSDAIAAKGSEAPKALPKPKTKLGKDFKQPKSGKGGTPRMTQQSQRAKGTNPRQQPGYKRKTKTTPGS